MSRRIDWDALTDVNSHRPWPLPSRPWLMTMSWLDLLFAHWSIDATDLRQRVPSALELDTFDGLGYLSLVPFRMEHVGPRGLGWLPGKLPGPRSFPELNVRTYVTHQGKPGVWFFSLDAADSLAVWGARMGFHLPYFNAEITVGQEDGWTIYNSRRCDRRLGPGDLEARYRPIGDPLVVRPGSLEYWLTERYCLYVIDRRGRVRRGDIHHRPWSIYQAEAEFVTNTVAEAHGLELVGEPMVQFAQQLDVLGWWLDS